MLSTASKKSILKCLGLAIGFPIILIGVISISYFFAMLLSIWPAIIGLIMIGMGILIIKGLFKIAEKQQPPPYTINWEYL